MHLCHTLPPPTFCGTGPGQLAEAREEVLERSCLQWKASALHVTRMQEIRQAAIHHKDTCMESVELVLLGHRYAWHVEKQQQIASFLSAIRKAETNGEHDGATVLTKLLGHVGLETVSTTILQELDWAMFSEAWQTALDIKPDCCMAFLLEQRE